MDVNSEENTGNNNAISMEARVDLTREQKRTLRIFNELALQRLDLVTYLFSEGDYEELALVIHGIRELEIPSFLVGWGKDFWARLSDGDFKSRLLKVSGYASSVRFPYVFPLFLEYMEEINRDRIDLLWLSWTTVFVVLLQTYDDSFRIVHNGVLYFTKFNPFTPNDIALLKKLIALEQEASLDIGDLGARYDCFEREIRETIYDHLVELNLTRANSEELSKLFSVAEED